ncbi:AAA family ATPase [Microvirga sp. HBU67558]|uniref:tyrosine-protein kinase domain-containing protein n=1 Tax=Microvirga sp. HBU67558 TaxID=2824562 RepID=UPI001B3640F2|nr:AAA family ATPase [Microvirga sp. HBU67558]
MSRLAPDLGMDDNHADHGAASADSARVHSPASPPRSADEDRVDLAQFWSVVTDLLRRHIRLVVSLTLLVGLASVIGFSKLENKFTATAVIILDQGASRLLATPTPDLRNLPQLNADAEVEILKSENVALRVLEKLGPTLPPEFSPEPSKFSVAMSAVTQPLSDFIASVLGPSNDGSSPATPGQGFALGGTPDSIMPDPLPRSKTIGLRALKENVQIRRRALTDVIAIESTFTRPVLAAYVANAYAASYFEEQRSAKLRAVEQVEAMLKTRLSELDAELKSSGQQLGLRQDYQDAQARLHELEKQRDSVSVDARLISAARPPRNPDFPGAMLLGTVGVVVSTAFSFAFALGVAYLREVRTRRIRTEGELEQATAAHNLASIPQMKWRRKKALINLIKGPLTESGSLYMEAIRKLYYNFTLATRSTRLGSVLITSTESNEGKTTLALSLGRVSASAGARVVIVDCNIREPKLDGMLGLNNEFGFTDLLIGTADKQHVIQSDPDSTCKIIAAGGAGHESTERAFRVEAMSEVVRKLQADYDLVLLIAPPVMENAEGLLLLGSANYVLYVVSAGRTSSADLQANLKHIRRVTDGSVFTAFNVMANGG